MDRTEYPNRTLKSDPKGWFKREVSRFNQWLKDQYCRTKPIRKEPGCWDAIGIVRDSPISRPVVVYVEDSFLNAAPQKGELVKLACGRCWRVMERAIGEGERYLLVEFVAGRIDDGPSILDQLAATPGCMIALAHVDEGAEPDDIRDIDLLLADDGILVASMLEAALKVDCLATAFGYVEPELVEPEGGYFGLGGVSSN